jgi:hypothetical protein
MGRKKKIITGPVDLDREFEREQKVSSIREELPIVETPAPQKQKEYEGGEDRACRKMPWTPPKVQNVFEDNPRQDIRVLPQSELEEIQKTTYIPPSKPVRKRPPQERMQVKCCLCGKTDEKYPSEIASVQSYMCKRCRRRNIEAR